MQSRVGEDTKMQMGGGGRTSGKEICVRETTTIIQWQQIRAKGS